MHRKSNTQCNEINSDFSIKNYPFTCNYKQLPQSMRPFANRMCSNYDFTKNGIPSYGADPVKTCKKSVVITQEPVKESYTNGNVKTIYPVYTNGSVKTIPAFINYIEPYRVVEIPSYPTVQNTYIPVIYYYNN